MPPSEPMRALLVKTRSHRCALPLEDVIETMRPLPIRPLAGKPPFVKGVALVRGTGLPVLDLGILLGEPNEDDVTRFVTVRAGTRSAVLAVASVLGIASFDEAEFQALPPILVGEGVEAMGVSDATLILMLRAARLVPEALWPLGTLEEEVR